MKNNGPDTATNVNLIDNLPAGTSIPSVSGIPSGGFCTLIVGLANCNLGDIVSGGSVTLTVVTTVNVPSSVTSITNTVSVSATEIDSDSSNNSETETTTVTHNRAPTCVNDSVAFNEDTIVSRNLLPKCTDPDTGDTIEIEIVSLNLVSVAPLTISDIVIAGPFPFLLPSDTVKLNPSLNFNGSAGSLKFQARDNSGVASNVATLDVTVLPVNDPPVAKDDSATTNEDQDVDIDVLINDSDVEGSTLAVTGVTQGADGAVTINPSGTVNYDPDLNFNGSDMFSYTVSEVLPETCQDIRDADPSAGDGDYEIYPNGNMFTVYCHDMSGTPSDYLTLVNTGGNFNYGQYTAGGASFGSTVRTNYSKVRLDPINLLVNIGDQTFASSVGSLSHGGPVTSMSLGTAAACISGWNAAGRANVDLTGTPFFVNDTFSVGGNDAAGAATFSAGNQVVNVTGGGYCGWNLPSLWAYNPFNGAGGFRLNLGFNGPNGPTPLSASAKVFVTVVPVHGIGGQLRRDG